MLAKLNHHNPLMTTRSVCQLLGITSRTLMRWRAQGKFPKPIQLSARSLRYRWSDVQAHLARLQEERS